MGAIVQRCQSYTSGTEQRNPTGHPPTRSSACTPTRPSRSPRAPPRQAPRPAAAPLQLASSVARPRRQRHLSRPRASSCGCGRRGCRGESAASSESRAGRRSPTSRRRGSRPGRWITGATGASTSADASTSAGGSASASATAPAVGAGSGLLLAVAPAAAAAPGRLLLRDDRRVAVSLALCDLSVRLDDFDLVCLVVSRTAGSAFLRGSAFFFGAGSSFGSAAAFGSQVLREGRVGFSASLSAVIGPSSTERSSCSRRRHLPSPR